MQVFVIVEWTGYESITIRRVFDKKEKAEDFIESRKIKDNFVLYERTLT
ncbi:hypothetical protein LCGC14_1279000 [marine sediment metagenome]|uniref:DUF7336 domain-containing protein n=1 Tax=marine sediment metagenome TaxID=412755 RepID=A0A0F9LH38_9ZZZZ